MREIIQAILHESTSGLLTKRLSTVFHVGEMDITKKRSHSYEGKGLSVSLHPYEWSKISEFTSGTVFKLNKPNGVFVDAHKLNKTQRSKIESWGIEKGLAQTTTKYRVKYYDENEEEYYCEFPTYDEAMYEADDNEEMVQEIKGGIKATQRMEQELGHKIDLVSVFDYLLTLYVEKETTFDGIWWADKLDVYALSAPRGVIFNDRLPSWKVINTGKSI